MISPVFPGKWNRVGVDASAVYPSDLLSRRCRAGESVIRLSWGRHLVNLLPVARRTNAL